MRLIDADSLKTKVEAMVEHRMIESDYDFGRNQAFDYVADILIDDAPTESTNTPTNAPTELISRADAIEAIASRDETDGTVKVFTGREVNEILSALPSADAVATFRTGQTYGKSTSIRELVEVVRCKDCKHAHMTYGGECKYCDMWEEDGEALYLDGDFFCAYGERREP